MTTVKNRTPAEVMPLVLRLLEIIGVWGESRHRYKYILILLAYIFGIVLPKVCFGYPSPEAAIRGFAELTMETNIFLGVFTIYLWPARFQLFIADLQSYFSIVLRDYQPKCMKDYFHTVNGKAHKYSRFYCIYMTCVCTVYCIGPLWVNVSVFRALASQDNSSAGASEVEFTLHFEQGFYWLNNRSSLTGYTIFTVFIVPIMYICAYTGTTKVIAVFNMIKCCQMTLHVVVLKIKHLARLPSGGQERVQELADIWDMHQRALQCCELLELILQPMLLIQLTLCILIWCTMMVYFTVSGINVNFMTMFILFFFVSIETFGYCYLGTQLSQESVDVGVALYDSSWYEFDTGTQQKVAFMVMRSQCAVRLTAARFYAVDMEQFGAMLNLSYSFFVVLKDMLRN